MSAFSDWEFMLNGDAVEFRQRSSETGSSYFNIYGGVDHWLDCPNNDFRMTSIFCEGETDPDIAWQIGYELVSLFNGASVLLNKNYRKASIFKVLYQSREVAYFPKNSVPSLLGKPPASQDRINEEFDNGSKSSIKFPLIHFATENKDAYFILKPRWPLQIPPPVATPNSPRQDGRIMTVQG